MACLKCYHASLAMTILEPVSSAGRLRSVHERSRRCTNDMFFVKTKALNGEPIERKRLVSCQPTTVHHFRKSKQHSCAVKCQTGTGLQVERTGPMGITHHFDRAGGQAKIHYVECGDSSKPLVILLHGFPCFWQMWDCQIEALVAAGYHVIALDMRGYADSEKPTQVEAYSRKEITGDVKAIIYRHGQGKPAHVVGHDWGAMVAWALASDCPDHVQRLVILNVPHPDVYGQAVLQFNNFEQILRSYYVFLFQLPHIPEIYFRIFGSCFLRRLYTSNPAIPLTEDKIDMYGRAFRDPGSWKAAVNYYRAGARGLWSPPPGMQNKVEAPVLVIWGERDSFLLSELADPPPNLVPQATVERLPKATHWVMWDEPQEVNKLVLNFLQLAIKVP